ncbi:MAG TPA: hypothetical protein VHV78_15405 [Gemmatimonadaceae bacterium]|nr:hypothetical protein [Gemmatimonadaceae bacterium]
MTLAATSACSSRSARERSSSGTLDTAALNTGSVSPAAGPAVQITRTDSKSIDKSMKYELTPQNFAAFVNAADSIYALEQRDPTVRAYLSNNLTDAGSTVPDAGLKWLEADTVLSKTIESAGISVRDYFVASIAIASAQRFVPDPKAAPPTATLAKNARFLGAHKAELDHLKNLRDNIPDVLTTP